MIADLQETGTRVKDIRTLVTLSKVDKLSQLQKAFRTLPFVSPWGRV